MMKHFRAAIVCAAAAAVALAVSCAHAQPAPSCGNNRDIAACDLQFGCRWDSGLGACRPSCDRFPTMESCRTDPSCLWSWESAVCFGSGVHGCASVTTEATCAAFRQCLWRAQSGSNVSACTSACPFKYDAATGCLSDKWCNWNPVTSVCAAKCWDEYASQSACALNRQDCLWHAPAQVCAPNCSNFPQQTTCNAQKGCAYSDWGCGLDCSLFSNDRTACAANRCDYNTPLQICQRGCGMNLNMMSCREHLGCRWFVNNNSCARGGIWGCLSLTESALCAAQPQCRWVVLDGIPQCNWKCDGLSQNFCGAHSYCFWSTNATKCYPSCKDSFFNQLACEEAGSGWCEWNAAKNTCVNYIW